MSTAPRRSRLRGALSEFLATEVAGGALLVAAAIIAMVLANSPWSAGYFDLLDTEIGATPFGLPLRHDVGHWINDAVMVLFFFVVGLEIKRELTVGELRDRRNARLPVLAALGGMLFPAAIYALTVGGGEGSGGWGIPMATDIAFAIGVMALLGSRVPPPLKLFLLTLAIVDDIGAILVIAVFYSGGIAPGWLLGAAACVGVMIAMERAGIVAISAYLLPGFVMWLCTLEAGIHPTIAGVVAGLLTPAVARNGREVIATLEHRLHPWSSYVVVPLFALANAGIELSRDVLDAAWTSRITWGIVLGLVAGKTIGITLATLAGKRTGAGTLHPDISRRHILGAASVGGIGFTVSLFVAELAFDDRLLLDQARLGIIAGSLLSALLGSAVLLGARPGRDAGAGIDRAPDGGRA